MSRRPIAAIDIGSNSVHLTLARVVDGRIETMMKLKDPARLAAHIGSDGYLDAATMDRAILTLARFRDLADVQRAEVRAMATAALRSARNKHEFIDRAAREAGVKVELISGNAEARLSYRGVRHGLPKLDGKAIITVDVGGGSTDLAHGTGDDPDFTASAAVGSLTTATRYLSDPVNRSKIKRARRGVKEALHRPLTAIARNPFELAIATSGSIQRLARLARPRSSSLHGHLLSVADLNAAAKVLAAARTGPERCAIPGMDHARADSLLGGAIVFQELAKGLGIETWTVSVTALRTGLILDTWLKRSQG